MSRVLYIGSTWWQKRTKLEKILVVLASVSYFISIALFVSSVFLSISDSVFNKSVELINFEIFQKLLQRFIDKSSEGHSIPTLDNLKTNIMEIASIIENHSKLKDQNYLATEKITSEISNVEHLTPKCVNRSQINEFEICSSQICVKAAAALLEAMDLSINPCEDFFQFSCGNWNRKKVIPEDKSSYTTFIVLREEVQANIKELLEMEILKNDSKTTVMAKLSYSSCMNTTTIAELGFSPLISILNKWLHDWPIISSNWEGNHFDFEMSLALMRKHGINCLFNMKIYPDNKNSSINRVILDQPVLTFPNKKYYFQPKYEKHRQAYANYLMKVSRLMGAQNYSQIQSDAIEVFNFEKMVANILTTTIDQHNEGFGHMKMKFFDLQKNIPQIDFRRYFQVLMSGDIISNEEIVVVTEFKYFLRLVGLVTDVNHRILANFLGWKIVQHYINDMPIPFQRAKLDFDKILSGKLAREARWQTCTNYVNENMGMTVGAMFIKNNYNAQIEEEVQEIISNVQKAFQTILQNVAWMDEDTKLKAMEKLKNVKITIGYPDDILDSEKLDKDFDSIEITKYDHFENKLQFQRHWAEVEMKDLHLPVDKNKWMTNPATVNAFYTPLKNSITLPAAILQPPFFRLGQPRSLNYGGIGTIIGHEITHGFDDKGRQFNKDGNVEQWWSDNAIKNFMNKAQCIIDQYKNYTIGDGIYLNGFITQGENMADNGGLKEAFLAFKQSMNYTFDTHRLPGLQTFNHEQLFFISFANVWCGSYRPTALQQNIFHDVHSPRRFRVIGTLANSEYFAKSFSCPKGSPMNPVMKCNLW